MQKRQVFINGRFLTGPNTAVNAVARDLSVALHHLSEKGEASGWNITFAVPPSVEEAARATGVPVRVLGPREGIAWEQRDLPAVRRDGIVAGFFNTVPLWGSGYVTMLHDAHVFTTPASYGRATRVWRQLLSRRAGQGDNRIVTVSEYSKRALLEVGIGSEDRIGVVYNGLGPVGQVTPESAVLARLGLTKDRAYCVALASLLPHKNIALLLQAFADPALAHLRLVLVGKADRASFEAAGHAPTDNVHFAGFVSDAELAALYDGALAVCLPSTEEGFGLPALEGMARGAPVVIAPCAALPEVVADQGIEAAADDPKAWVAALLRLEQSPNLQADLARGGRDRAAQFSWENSARAFVGHLDRWFPNGPL